MSLHTYLLLMDIIGRCHRHQLQRQGLLYPANGSQPRDSGVSIPSWWTSTSFPFAGSAKRRACRESFGECAVIRRKEADLATCTFTDQVLPPAAPACYTDRTTAKSSSSSWADIKFSSWKHVCPHSLYSQVDAHVEVPHGAVIRNCQRHCINMVWESKQATHSSAILFHEE